LLSTRDSSVLLNGTASCQVLIDCEFNTKPLL
jgi:hypothetical protein